MWEGRERPWPPRNSPALAPRDSPSGASRHRLSGLSLPEARDISRDGVLTMSRRVFKPVLALLLGLLFLPVAVSGQDDTRLLRFPHGTETRSSSHTPGTSTLRR